MGTSKSERVAMAPEARRAVLMLSVWTKVSVVAIVRGASNGKA